MDVMIRGRASALFSTGALQAAIKTKIKINNKLDLFIKFSQ